MEEPFQINVNVVHMSPKGRQIISKHVFPNKINVSGGDEMDDIIEDIITNPEEAQPLSIDTSATIAETKSFSQQLTSTRHDRIIIFPQNKISELKDKIFLATDIPPCFQHIWTEKQGAIGYEIIFGSQHMNIDARRIPTIPETVLSTPIITTFASRSDDLQVISNDMFILVGSISGTIFVTDMRFYVAAGDKSRYSYILSDQSVLNFIYYGFVVPFFPMNSKQMFVEFLASEKDLKKYPIAFPSVKNVESVMTREISLMRDIYSFQRSTIKSHRKNISMFIRKVTLDCLQYENVPIINSRALFDELELNDEMNACRVSLVLEGKIHIIQKTFGESEFQYNPQQDVVNVVEIQFVDDVNHFSFFIEPNGHYSVEMDTSVPTTVEQVKEICIDIMKRAIGVISRGKSVRSGFRIFPPTDINLSNISTTIVYNRFISDAGFKKIKETLDEYDRANFIEIKSKEDHDVTCVFKRGIYRKNILTSLEKIVTLPNHYDYVSNVAVINRLRVLLARTYLTKIFHSTSGLHISIDNMESDEFKMIEVLILYLCKDVSGKESDLANLQRSSRQVKTLHEQDPKLYDFKSVGTNQPYSKICQKNSQPIMFSQSLLNEMPQSVKKKSTRYINFTTNKPTYYYCPNPKYPHLRFITGKHPDNYCIPCCKMLPAPSSPSNPKSKIHSTCLSQHVLQPNTQSQISSRYITSYGFPLMKGRLSRLPEGILDDLFYENINRTEQFCYYGENYFIYGTGDDKSFMHCLSTSMNMSNEDLADKVASMLTESKIKIISPSLQLNDTINKLRFSPNSLSQDTWVRIAKIIFSINVLCFVDDGDGSIFLQIPHGVRHADIVVDPLQRTIIVVRKGDEFMPIFLINTDIYFRSGVISKMLFDYNDEPIQMTISMIKDYMETQLRIGTSISLDIMKRFLSEGTYTIINYFANRMGQIYFIKIHSNFHKRTFEIPIEESPYDMKTVGNNRVFFTSPDIHTTSTDIQAFFDSFNKWSAGEMRKRNIVLPILEPKERLIYKENVVGVTCDINYYFVPDENAFPDLPSVIVPLNPVDVNKTLEKAKIDKIDRSVAQKTFHKYNLYSTFVSNFASNVGRMRNKKVREAIKDALKSGSIDKIQLNKRDKEKILETDNWEDYYYNFDKEFVETSFPMDFEALRKIVTKHVDLSNFGVPEADEMIDMLAFQLTIPWKREQIFLYNIHAEEAFSKLKFKQRLNENIDIYLS